MDIKDVYLIMKNPDSTEGYKEKAREVIKRPIPKHLIKQRDGGFGKKLDYIEGDTVIELLDEAFGAEGWSFQIVGKYIVQSVPKFNKKTNQMEEQPPYVEVHGRLIVPGFGVREQFGTKTLIGGASEQEGASKAAATDALKKCATLFGIGLELYGDKENTESETETSSYSKSGYGSQSKSPSTYSSQRSEPANEGNPWAGKEGEIRKLKELKAILGIDDNNKLNPFVAEFTGSKGDTYEMITPANIAAFNKFLERKAASL